MSNAKTIALIKALAGGGGGGGGGSLVVHGNVVDNAVVLDKTVSEIQAAMLVGPVIVVDYYEDFHTTQSMQIVNISGAENIWEVFCTAYVVDGLSLVLDTYRFTAETENDYPTMELEG